VCMAVLGWAVAYVVVGMTWRVPDSCLEISPSTPLPSPLLPPSNACPQVHDELLFEVKEGSLRQVASMIRRVMEGVVRLRVPLPVKLQSGPSWGQLSDLNLEPA
jgi:hypothetical protein